MIFHNLKIPRDSAPKFILIYFRILIWRPTYCSPLRLLGLHGGSGSPESPWRSADRKMRRKKSLEGSQYVSHNGDALPGHPEQKMRGCRWTRTLSWAKTLTCGTSGGTTILRTFTWVRGLSHDGGNEWTWHVLSSQFPQPCQTAQSSAWAFTTSVKRV